MKRSRSPRDLWASLLPIAGAALAAAVASRFPALAAGKGLTPALLLVLIFAGVAAAGHRPFVATTTVGLGAVVLPVALELAGAVPAAGLAATSLLAAEI